MELLDGNRVADLLAEKGAALRAPPQYLQAGEFVRKKVARIVHTFGIR